MSDLKSDESELAHLHIEIEREMLQRLRELRPGYGEVSRIIRGLIKGFIDYVERTK